MSRSVTTRVARGIVAAAAALALVATTLSPAAGATRTETEPNGDIRTANALPLGDTMQGTTEMANSRWDDDYYAITIPAAGRTTIDLRFARTTSSTAYNLYLYNDKGGTVLSFTLTSGDGDGSWLRGREIFLPPGTFYLNLRGSSDWDSWGKPYGLRVTHTPGDVELEPNDSIRLATELPLGKTITGSALSNSRWDDDYFGISIPAAGRVTLDLRFPTLTSSTAYYVYLYNDKGGTVQSFTVTSSHRDGAWLRSQAIFLREGRYSLMLRAADDWDSWNKVYTLKVTHAAGLAEQEPNGSATLATTLPLGKAIKGSSLIAGSSWDYDYYAVSLESAAKVAVELTAPTAGDATAYELRVLSGSQATLQFENVPPGKTRRMTVDLPAGDSYIRVAGSSDYQSWGKEYTLKVLRVLTSTPTPTITGTAAVGKTLKANVKAWKPSKVTLMYQWLRDGKAIKGATTSSYTLAKADAGTKITVKVTGSKSGYPSVSKTSKAVTVAKVKATVKVTVPKSVAKNKQATVKVAVTTPVANPTGTVKVTVNGKSVSVKLTAAAKGKVSVKLPKIAKAGSYKVGTVFTPSGTTAKSTAKSATVTKTLKVT
ncbi:MAG: hypothetical protein IPJ61_01845 [Tessaracoccus sp.]|uniref:hypothetical protein n=1 Tax=Tessaracoccus sp. TaxID=1971211 RepID=UPI001ECB2AB9|nr:hypothetical protein [Tessaracoccus sp.]MBK7819834.1 hypothetical protein [Tessaracoccus sp.]